MPIDMDSLIERLAMNSPFGIDGTMLTSPDVTEVTDTSLPFGQWMTMSFAAPEEHQVPLPHKLMLMAATAATGDRDRGSRGRSRSRRGPRKLAGGADARDGAGDHPERCGVLFDIDPYFESATAHLSTSCLNTRPLPDFTALARTAK